MPPMLGPVSSRNGGAAPPSAVSLGTKPPPPPPPPTPTPAHGWRSPLAVQPAEEEGSEDEEAVVVVVGGSNVGTHVGPSVYPSAASASAVSTSSSAAAATAARHVEALAPNAASWRVKMPCRETEVVGTAGEGAEVRGRRVAHRSKGVSSRRPRRRATVGTGEAQARCSPGGRLCALRQESREGTLGLA